MHEVADLDHRQVGGQPTGLRVRAEPDQLAPQLRQVPADVADHRDPSAAGGEPGRTRRARGSCPRAPPRRRSARTAEMLSIRRCTAAISRTAWATMLRSIGDSRSSVSTSVGRSPRCMLHELVAQPQPLQHLEHLDQVRRPGGSGAWPTRRRPQPLGGRQRGRADAQRRPAGDVDDRQQRVALMSKMPSRRARTSRTERSRARLDSDSCSSRRMVPGWRRRSVKTRAHRRQPGVAVDRPTVHQQRGHHRRPGSPPGPPATARPAARQSALVRANGGVRRGGPVVVAAEPPGPARV